MKSTKVGQAYCITFDYMQNLPCPNIQTSVIFYARQLWWYVFGVHNCVDNSATIYTYDELNGQKGANNVISILFQYLKTLPDLKKRTTLYLICGNCPGQNKNRIFVRFASLFVHILKLFRRIIGHSYLPNDQDFAVIKRKKDKLDAEIPSDWHSWIARARSTPSPFKAVHLDYTSFFNFEKCCSHLFLTSPKPAMKLKSYRMFEVSITSSHVEVKYDYKGSWFHIAIRNRIPPPLEITILELYNAPLAVPPANLKDIQTSQYLKKNTSLSYYEQFKAVCTNAPEPDVHVETSEDDSSSYDEM